MNNPDTLASPFRAPSLPLLALEPLRAVLDFFAAQLQPEPPPVGDGHHVIVYPGLAGGPITTALLRKALKRAGFEAIDWDGGINTGPQGDFDKWLDKLVAKALDVQAASGGRKVSLLGWSLGGIYAREVAKRAPDSVRQVITLGTPFAAMAGANHAGAVFRLLNGDTSQLTPQMEARLRQRPPVPTTSVFSKSDGVVSWRGCVEKLTHLSESIEVQASHLGMGTHPQVLRVVTERLAQPEGQWKVAAVRRPT